MNVFRKLLAAGVVLCATRGLIAAEPETIPAADAPIVVVVDLDANLALVPEGTVVPQGLKIFFGIKEASDDLSERRAPRAGRRPLVFAYAADETFTEARAAIERARPDVERETGRRVISPLAPIKGTYGRPVYVYYPDGSVHFANVYRQVDFPPVTNQTDADSYVTAAPSTKSARIYLDWSGSGWGHSRVCSEPAAGGTCGNYWLPPRNYFGPAVSDAELDRVGICPGGTCPSYYSTIQYTVPY